VRKVAFIGLAVLSIVLGGVIPASAAVEPAATGPLAAGAPAAATTTPSLSGSRVSCASAKSCLAINENVDSAGNPTPVADAWNGTAWKPVAVPLPKGAAGGGLNGVSCKQAACLAVGYYSTASGVYPLALKWSGKALALVAAPPMPAGSGDASLGDVSCVNATHCVMIGSATPSAGLRVVIDTWNGVKWTMQASAPPKGMAEVMFNGLSCVSATFCVAGGVSLSSSIVFAPLLASWNGKTVTMAKAPVLKGASTPEITDVSCVSATSCAATGLSMSSSSFYGFTDVLTGKTWKAAAIAWPKGSASSDLLAVSCTSPRSCVAAGQDGITNTNTANDGDAAAVAYDGKTWTVQKSVPGPGKGYASVFGGIYCVTATDCVVSGLTGKTSGSAGTPINGVWNGKSWKLFRLP
jgi:hypothetical protein